MSLKTLCPDCGALIEPVINSGVSVFPPTGGDYEWVEIDTEALCINCGFEFEICVRLDIYTKKMTGIISSPLPKKEEITVFAAAQITHYGNDKFSYIDLLELFDNLKSAESYLKKNPNNIKLTNKRGEIIYINHKGHFNLNNQPINSAFQTLLSFKI